MITENPEQYAQQMDIPPREVNWILKIQTADFDKEKRNLSNGPGYFMNTFVCMSLTLG